MGSTAERWRRLRRDFWLRLAVGSLPSPRCRAKDMTDSLPRNRLVDEGPYAAATAALYPNIEHVLIRSKGRSPLDELDRAFFLFDRPSNGLESAGLSYDAATRAETEVGSLNGAIGNIGLSYDGMELLPELFRSGRWFRLWREARALCVGADALARRTGQYVRTMVSGSPLGLAQ